MLEAILKITANIVIALMICFVIVIIIATWRGK